MPSFSPPSNRAYGKGSPLNTEKKRGLQRRASFLDVGIEEIKAMAAMAGEGDVVLGKAGGETHGTLTTDLLIGWSEPHPVWPSPREGVSEVYQKDLNSSGLSAGTALERFFPETMSSLGGTREGKSYRMGNGFK